jgi:oligopeptide transport system ATP-binding protein
VADHLLELSGLQKRFPIKRGLLRSTKGYVYAVDNVDLVIDRGENLGLVGESGSGKTTLGRLILRLLDADRGRILFQGQDITGFSDKMMKGIRKKMQVVFQDPFSSLDPRFSVEGIILEGMDRKRKARVAELLDCVGLSSDVAERFPDEFSGGERQRIAIARSLVNNPRLIILDEAVSSLDVLTQSQIINLLRELQQRFGLTYLFISHNLRLLKRICSRIAVMYQGKIVETALTKDIFERPAHPYTRQLLSAALDYRVVRQT